MSGTKRDLHAPGRSQACPPGLTGSAQSLPKINLHACLMAGSAWQHACSCLPIHTESARLLDGVILISRPSICTHGEASYNAHFKLLWAAHLWAGSPLQCSSFSDRHLRALRGLKFEHHGGQSGTTGRNRAESCIHEWCRRNSAKAAGAAHSGQTVRLVITYHSIAGYSNYMHWSCLFSPAGSTIMFSFTDTYMILPAD